jgi:hypothetical protein
MNENYSYGWWNNCSRARGLKKEKCRAKKTGRLRLWSRVSWLLAHTIHQTITVGGCSQRRRRGLGIILRSSAAAGFALLRFCIAGARSAVAFWWWGLGDDGTNRAQLRAGPAEASRLDPFAPLGDTDAGCRVADWRIAARRIRYGRVQVDIL